ncbi:DUF342 domain-containing protein [Acetivibrio saccincola]|uniref:Flagellar Assembly Protein A N-terminal region domain-containing protein n=1 Tax=Acetivibrio saccincola TaxID=1677857 RepID=A0A2K9EGR8_9FIRM|nr:FapA family protein [Acetivibrio saccincola]AUG57113.1 hypothetical protein HVS_05915 [Acetivibrio saccincola]
MKQCSIYRNKYIEIFSKDDRVYLEAIRPGLSLEQFDKIISSYPFITIKNLRIVGNALNTAPTPPLLIGELKEQMELVISDDGLRAWITFRLPEEELDFSKREQLIKKIYSLLNEKGIVYGIKQEVLFQALNNNTPYLIAEGIPPQHGEDCIINMYKIEPPTPEIREDGSVNHYNLKLINRVKAGDWLGERIDATKGVPGRSIFGTDIPASDGKNFPLKYDRKTVYEVYQDNVTLLFSKVNGAVDYKDDGSIFVSNHLLINGDVDFKTGNIKFDGCVTIMGTVADGFYVEATKDIEINGALGLGNIKGITSHEGNIYIRGGIAAKNHVEIKAKKDVFIKFLDNVTVKCGGAAHIGFYCINSNVYAKEVYIESFRGNIIGGRVYSQIKISVPILGSALEKRTVLKLEGFDRKKLELELENVNNKIEHLKTVQTKIKKDLMKMETVKTLTPQETARYNNKLKQFISIKDELNDLEESKKNIYKYLNIKGEGEIVISKRIHPNCLISIKNHEIEIKNSQLHTTFIYKDGNILEL